MAKATEAPKTLSLLDNLKLQADSLGVKYSPTIGQETLAKRVNEAILEKIENTRKVAVKRTAPKNEEESLADERSRKYKAATRLVRVQATCFDVRRKDKKGEYIMGGNALVGTIRKYIEFGVPWHMPKILVDLMKEREHQEWINGKTQFGITQKISRMVKTYAVQDLDVLTTVELKNLADQQALANNIKDA